MSRSSSSSMEGSGIATGMMVSSVSSSGSACVCFSENVTRAGLFPCPGATSSTFTSTSSPTRTTSRGCEMRFHDSSEMWIRPSMRGACGSSSESSTKAPKSESDTMTPDTRTPTSSAFAPRSCKRALGHHDLRAVHAGDLHVDGLPPPGPPAPQPPRPCRSGAPSSPPSPAAGTAGGGHEVLLLVVEGRQGRGDRRGAGSARALHLQRAARGHLRQGRNARNRPLNTRKMSPPRFATSTRPFTGSPFARALVSAFFASEFLESSAFLPLPTLRRGRRRGVAGVAGALLARARTPRPRDAETARRAIGVLGAPDDARAGARWDARAAVETATHCATADAMVPT